jgi:lambda family phage portal protein
MTVTISVQDQVPLKPRAEGAHDGSSRTSHELASWTPPIQSANASLFQEKEILDARGIDLSRNDGFIAGAAHIHRDSIVGAQYKLNARPDYAYLGADPVWADEFQQVVESSFGLYAESGNNWIDASGMNSLTGMIRLAVGTYLSCGEVLATAEWKSGPMRPYRTAIQMIDVNRLSSPHNLTTDPKVRKGIRVDSYGEALSYFIRMGHMGEVYDFASAHKWKEVAARKPWGRKQVLHIFEQMRVDQSRGVGDMVSTLKEMKMTKKFKDVTLQQAIVNATYAASITSELPPAEAYASLGLDGGLPTYAQQFLADVAAYTGTSKNIHLDGVKIPHLYPGTKLNLDSPGTPGGVGEAFEQSLLRHVAASLGLSYEQFSRDYTRTNYSSARASMGETWKFMQSRKKMVADRFANDCYSLWLEEAWAMGEVPKPLGVNFYDRQNKEALCRCDWIGASRGQIDEFKETQAAILRIESGLSTYEDEIAKLGKDWRVVFEQRQREANMIADKKLVFVTANQKNMSANSGGQNV